MHIVGKRSDRRTQHRPERDGHRRGLLLGAVGRRWHPGPPSVALDGLAAAPACLVWLNTHDLDSVWAPAAVGADGRYYICFSAGGDSTHRMYVVSSDLDDLTWRPNMRS